MSICWEKCSWQTLQCRSPAQGWVLSNQKLGSTSLTFSSFMSPNGYLYKGVIYRSFKKFTILPTQRIQSLVLMFSLDWFPPTPQGIYHCLGKSHSPTSSTARLWFCFMYTTHLSQTASVTVSTYINGFFLSSQLLANKTELPYKGLPPMKGK